MTPLQKYVAKNGPLEIAEMDANWFAIEQGVADAQADADVALASLSGKAPLNHTHGVADLTATGTRDNTTVLHGDGVWRAPASASGGATILDQLTDVGIVGPVAAQVLRYTGTGWTNAALGINDVTNLATTLSTKADLASPLFTGNPRAPTPSPGDNDTSLATTEFVQAALAAAGSNPTLDAGLVSLAGLTGAGIVTATGTDVFAMRAIGVAAGTDIPDRAAADLRYAQLASPTLTGNPQAPTPAINDNDTSIATSEFVTRAVATEARAAVPQFEATTGQTLAVVRGTHQRSHITLSGAGATISFDAAAQGDGLTFVLRNRTGSAWTVPTFSGGTNEYLMGASHTTVASGGDAVFTVYTRNATRYVEINGNTAGTVSSSTYVTTGYVASGYVS